jgi:hypothetical protein
MTTETSSLFCELNIHELNAAVEALVKAATRHGFDKLVCSIETTNDYYCRLHYSFGDDFNFNERNWAYDLSDLVCKSYEYIPTDMTVNEFFSQFIGRIQSMPRRSQRELSHLAWRISGIEQQSSGYSDAVRAAFQSAWSDAMERAGLRALVKPSAADAD